MSKNITLFINDTNCNLVKVVTLATSCKWQVLKDMCNSGRFSYNGTLYKVGHFELYSTKSSLSSYGSNGCINLFPLDCDFIK